MRWIFLLMLPFSLIGSIHVPLFGFIPGETVTYDVTITSLGESITGGITYEYDISVPTVHLYCIDPNGANTYTFYDLSTLSGVGSWSWSSSNVVVYSREIVGESSAFRVHVDIPSSGPTGTWTLKSVLYDGSSYLGEDSSTFTVSEPNVSGAVTVFAGTAFAIALVAFLIVKFLL